MKRDRRPRLPGRSGIRTIIIIGIVLTLVLFAAMAIMIGYVQFSEKLTAEFEDSAFRIAHLAQTEVNVDRLDDDLSTEGNTIDYRNACSALQKLCDNLNAEFIYVIQPDTTDYAHITFVYNIVNTNSEFDPYGIGYVRDTTNDEYREKYRRLYEGVSDEETVVRDKGYIETGSHITAMIALHGTNGETTGILCVQRQMDTLTAARRDYSRHVIMTTLMWMVVVIGIFFFSLNRGLIRPLIEVKKETERFADEPSLPEPLLSDRIRSKNEIGQLARSVTKMETDTLSYIENLTRVTSEQQRIGTELELAAGIQQGMLNDTFPEHPAFDIFATMDPAKEVGGDFYDFYMIDDDHLALVMADVSGKGVPAALFMTISKILISDTVAMTVLSPSEVLRQVNERICQNNKLDMFVTVWLGILELSTGKLTAANAGHEYPAVQHHGGPFELLRDKHGFVIGGMSGVRYRDYELELEPGDAVFLYTDGIAEAQNAHGELFGTDRMIDALNRQSDADPKEILTHMRDAVDTFVGQAPQFDDMTALCLRYKGASDTSAS